MRGPQPPPARRVTTTVRLRPAPLVAAVAALLAAAPPAAALDGDALAGALAREARNAGVFSGAYARDLDSDRVFVAVRPDTPRIPASVEKLFVTSTALLRFGPDAQLQTRLAATAPADAEGVIAGDLHLVGGGDPTLSDAGLQQLVGVLTAAGVQRIEGDVVGDETRFDRLRGGPRTGGQPDRDLGGRLGALVLRRGFQADPARFAAQRLRALLRAGGVEVGGRARAGATPAEGLTELGVLASPTIGRLVALTNVPSDNFFAEMLLKDLGAQFGARGSTLSGARVVRSTMAGIGLRPLISDGSGLSRANRTSPRQVVQLLERMDEGELGPVWRRSLAVPGRSGTVRFRLRGTPAAGRCRVKTGTIIGVSNLVGVCRTAGGRRIGFAWLMNGVNPFYARPVQDRMTALVARYDD